MSGSAVGLVAVTVMGTTPSPESVVTGHLQRLRRERLELVARVGGQGTPLSQSDKIVTAKPVAVAKCRFVA